MNSEEHRAMLSACHYFTAAELMEQHLRTDGGRKKIQLNKGYYTKQFLCVSYIPNRVWKSHYYCDTHLDQGILCIIHVSGRSSNLHVAKNWHLDSILFFCRVGFTLSVLPLLVNLCSPHYFLSTSAPGDGGYMMLWRSHLVSKEGRRLFKCSGHVCVGFCSWADLCITHAS